MGCIYMWTNKVNGKRYIGKCHVDVGKRRKDHLRGQGSVPLKRAFAKYGVDNFDFEIIHDGILDAFLDDYEIEAIKQYKTLSPNGYNLRTGGGRGRHSAETRRKMSQYQSNRPSDHQRKLSEAHRGKKRSAEFCRKMSEVRKGKPHTNKGKPFSVEHRRKLSEAHKGQTPWMKGKKHSPEARRKLSEAGKGRIVSAETRKKMSKAHKSRYAEKRLPYKEFYLSLPPDMSITEKRKRVKEFSGKDAKTVWRWINQWQSEIK